MTALLNIGDVSVISHQQFLETLYSNVILQEKNKQFRVKKGIFGVRHPYKTSQKACKLSISEYSKDAAIIAQRYETVKEKIATLLLNYCDASNVSTRAEVDNIAKELNVGSLVTCNGGNAACNSLVVEIKNNLYLIPPKCSFFCCDVKDLTSSLFGRTYDVIVLDPPWWNKYIRRKRKINENEGYSMMWNEELADLPIGDLLANNGLVAVWCTNAKSHITALTDEIFPRWGLSVVAQWYWLKVTNTGEVITPFSAENRKQPFERILFGARLNQRTLPNPENNKILVSVPSAIHSHKPPLCEVLGPFLPEEPRGLEVFARYLLSNWTSVGNEVLKLQNLSFFSELVR